MPGEPEWGSPDPGHLSGFRDSTRRDLQRTVERDRAALSFLALRDPGGALGHLFEYGSPGSFMLQYF